MPAITNVNELQAMNDDLAGSYWLLNDIDASATAGWNGGAGFIPVGNAGTKFTGSFNGLNHTISELVINRGGTDYVGLFGYTSGVAIRNVGLTDVDITGDDYVGGVIGRDNGSAVSNSYVTGSVTGNDIVGGFIGRTQNSIFTNCYSQATVDTTSGGDSVGGFVGSEYSDSTFTSCYATGSVNGRWFIGGFAGEAAKNDGDNTFNKCYATGNVSSVGAVSGYAGGFAGSAVFGDGTVISECYALGDVDVLATGKAGGFIGRASGTINISDCYARGDVTSTGADVGGFVGLHSEGIIIDCYSTGAVSGGADEGGFCGDNNDTITDCFWDTETSGMAVSDGGTGKTTSEMKTKATFTDAAWDFIIIWFINGITNDGYPFHWAMPPEPTPDAPRATVAVQDKITLECVRNIEMAAGGRFYIDEEGNAVYKSRYARNA